MRNNEQLRRAALAAHPASVAAQAWRAPESAFWCGAIGAGAGIMVELAVHLDVLSNSIVQLPESTATSRPAVINYLSMVKQLAAAWSTETRPQLTAAIEALAHVGTSVGQSFTREALANRSADGGRAAARVLDALLRRLAAPGTALATLGGHFENQLAGMACATHDLQTDIVMVSERLQSDHVHAFLLSQQVNALQSKIDDASMRQDAYWLQGPHSEQIRHEIALHSRAFEGVRRQLDHLHAEQAATRAEAHYLQNLMPSLTGYLGALDRIGAAIRATRAGTDTLLAELKEVKRMLAEQGPASIDVDAQLRAALPRWRELAADAARLGPARPATARRRRA